MAIYARSPNDEGSGVCGSFGFGWLGILLLRLNFSEFVASQPFIFSLFKALRRPFVAATYRDQGQCPVLNLIDSGDYFSDAFLIRTIFDGGAQLLWFCACRQGKSRLKPKVRVPVKVE